MSNKIKEATELEFLEWFFNNCDFGPADSDVRCSLMEEFEQSGKRVPRSYRVGYLEEEN